MHSVCIIKVLSEFNCGANIKAFYAYYVSKQTFVQRHHMSLCNTVSQFAIWQSMEWSLNTRSCTVHGCVIRAACSSAGLPHFPATQPHLLPLTQSMPNMLEHIVYLLLGTTSPTHPRFVLHPPPHSCLLYNSPVPHFISS